MLKKSKYKCQIHHFKKRMKSRQKIIAKDSIIQYIVNCIQTGKSKFIERQSNRVVIHDIIYDSKILRVVYDKQRQVPVTVFADSWLHPV